MELELAVLLILAAPRQEAVKVSILRFSLWPGLLTYTILDPIMLSDDESAGAESKTDCSDLDVDVTEKSDSVELRHVTWHSHNGTAFSASPIQLNILYVNSGKYCLES
jgi:hypothetical protein